MTFVAAQTDVIILCGGRGTRLSSVLGAAPKPMAPIGGKPFLEILIAQATRHGFKRFIFCIGYRAGVIESHFRPNPDFVFSREPEPLGTAGALKFCQPLRRSPVSLVMNGDSYCDLDLAGLIDFHRRRGGVGAIAVVSAAGRKDGGFVESDPEGKIVTFREKAEGALSHISAGIYVLGAAAFAAVPEGRPSSLEEEVFPNLIRLGLYAFPTQAALYDIGTPERLERFRRSHDAF